MTIKKKTDYVLVEEITENTFPLPPKIKPCTEISETEAQSLYFVHKID